jgi:hypothetical protein
MVLSEETQRWMLLPSVLQHDDQPALRSTERDVEEAHALFPGDEIRRRANGVDDHEPPFRSLSVMNSRHGRGWSVHRVELAFDSALLGAVWSEYNHFLPDVRNRTNSEHDQPRERRSTLPILRTRSHGTGAPVSLRLGCSRE